MARGTGAVCLLVVCAALLVATIHAEGDEETGPTSLLNPGGSQDAGCPNRCSGHGTCIAGTCNCHTGYRGEDCHFKVPCRNDCSFRGECKQGVCFCYSNAGGEDCSKDATTDYVTKGKFYSELRQLLEENIRQFYIRYLHRQADAAGLESWSHAILTGKYSLREVENQIRFSFEAQACPDDCNGHGRCLNGTCLCFNGWRGQSCALPTCPNDCSQRGKCRNGTCECQAGFTGPDCSRIMCPNDCSSRGTCLENGTCACMPGFAGEDCSMVRCPNDCWGRGSCVNGECLCQKGFGGSDCSVAVCPNNCSGNGQCDNGNCYCFHGWMGDDCSQIANFALRFSARDAQYCMVNYGNRTSLELGKTHPLTIEAWVKLDHAVTCRDVDLVIVDKYVGTQETDRSSWRFFINGCNGLDGHLGFWDNEAGAIYGATVLSPWSWHHVAVTFDGSKATFFVNATSDGTRPFVLGETSDRSLLIGRDIQGRYFDGLMDELRIYGRALTQIEIQSTMMRVLDGGDDNLLLYLDFNEGENRYMRSKTGTMAATCYRQPTWVESDSPVSPLLDTNVPVVPRQ